MFKTGWAIPANDAHPVCHHCENKSQYHVPWRGGLMANAVRCEACSTHADRPIGDMLGRFPDPLPNGWVKVNAGAMGGPLMPEFCADFCSWTCAAVGLTRFATETARGGDARIAA